MAVVFEKENIPYGNKTNKMKTRTYQKACDYCHATGFVPTGRQGRPSATTAVTEICPVCNGKKTITVTETEY